MTAPTCPSEVKLDILLSERRHLQSEVAELRQARAEPGPNLTVEQAAELLGCRRARAFELLAEGRLRRAKRVGRKTLVTRESVEAYAAAAPVPTMRPAERGGNGARKDPQAASAVTVKKPRYVVFAVAAALSLYFGCSRGDLPSCKGGDDIARAVQTAQAGRHEALKKFIAETVEEQVIAAKALNPEGNNAVALLRLRVATDRAIRYVAETDAAEWKRQCGN